MKPLFKMTMVLAVAASVFTACDGNGKKGESDSTKVDSSVSVNSSVDTTIKTDTASKVDTMGLGDSAAVAPASGDTVSRTITKKTIVKKTVTKKQ